LRQILKEAGKEQDREEALPYERGCVQNALSHVPLNGWIPISIRRDTERKPPADFRVKNMHKPCLAQHAAFLVQQDGGVAEHYRNEKTFNAPAGIRTLSRMEKMYNVRASGGPSSWLGPVLGVSNYLTFRGLVRYGFEDDARDLAEKTVRLFGRDIARFGAMHEYYQPYNGEPILNRGFQNWNYLVLNMIAWPEGKAPIIEF